MLRTEVDMYKVYDKWQEGLESFQCYLKVTPFATMKNFNNFSLNENVVPSSNSLKIFSKIRRKLDRNALNIIDFESNVSLDLALLINNHDDIKPILSLNHIFHPFGIVGDEEMAEKMIIYSDKLKTIAPKAYCFILDKERYKDTPVNDYMKFNNQYEITEEELPPVEVLKDMGINKIIYLSKDEAKEDVKYYLEYLKANELQVEEILKF